MGDVFPAEGRISAVAKAIRAIPSWCAIPAKTHARAYRADKSGSPVAPGTSVPSVFAILLPTDASTVGCWANSAAREIAAWVKAWCATG